MNTSPMTRINNFEQKMHFLASVAMETNFFHISVDPILSDFKYVILHVQ